MKIKIALILIVMLNVVLGGCASINRGQQLTKEMKSEKQMSDQIMEEITAALDARDADMLKAMFSEATLIKFDERAKEEGEALRDDEILDLDKQISGVMEFYHGMKVSYEGFISTATNADYGVVVKELTGQYTLKTDEETYQLIFQYKPIDDENSKEIGLSKLEIVTKENYDRDEFRWQIADKGSGIYWQE